MERGERWAEEEWKGVKDGLKRNGNGERWAEEEWKR